METKGKYYIKLHGAYAKNYFWSQVKQNWTSEPRDASFFDALSDAEMEQEYAQQYGPGEAIVAQATVDI